MTEYKKGDIGIVQAVKPDRSMFGLYNGVPKSYTTHSLGDVIMILEDDVSRTYDGDKVGSRVFGVGLTLVYNQRRGTKHAMFTENIELKK